MATTQPERRNECVVLEEADMKLESFSFDPESWWREMDPGRVTELRETFLGGGWGLSVTDGVRALEREDMDGKRLGDDGMHTVATLLGLKAEWEQEPEVDACGNPWCPKLIALFEGTLRTNIVQYDDDSKEARIIHQAGRHMETNNRIRFTPIYVAIEVGASAMRLRSNVIKQAEAYLTAQYGLGSRQTAYRWVRASSIIPQTSAVFAVLKKDAVVEAVLHLREQLLRRRGAVRPGTPYRGLLHRRPSASGA